MPMAIFKLNVPSQWKIENSKSRSVKVGDDVVFTQDQYDTIGFFSAPYTDLSID